MYSYYKMKNKWEREGQKTWFHNPDNRFHNKWVFIQLFLLDILDILHILDILYRCWIKNHFNKNKLKSQQYSSLLFPANKIIMLPEYLLLNNKAMKFKDEKRL